MSPHSLHPQGGVCHLLGTASATLPGVYVGPKRPWSLTLPIPLHSRSGVSSWAPTLLPYWLGTQEFKWRGPDISSPEQGAWPLGVTPGLGQDLPPAPGHEAFPRPCGQASLSSPSLSWSEQRSHLEEQGLSHL